MVADDNTPRYDRQLKLFGKEGQAAIDRTTVAILGLGGLGSHIAQQFAYLGMRKFVLVDADKAEVTNLNRLVGATANDVGRPKVAIAEAMIQNIQPKSTIAKHDQQVTRENISSLLSQVDLVIGAFDHDLPRLVTLEAASRLRIPYIDAASDINATPNFRLVYGGRVVTSGVTRGCLFCLDELDQREIRRSQLTEQERNDERRIYGVPSDMMDESGPSVVTINGVVSSVACTEAMVHVTGIRLPYNFLIYQAGELLDYEEQSGQIRVKKPNLPAACPYCYAYGLIEE